MHSRARFLKASPAGFTIQKARGGGGGGRAGHFLVDRTVRFRSTDRSSAPERKATSFDLFHIPARSFLARGLSSLFCVASVTCCMLSDSGNGKITGRDMSIISIVNKHGSLSIEFDTNQSTNIGNR